MSLTPETADRTRAPDMEQVAVNQRPKTSGHRNAVLFNYVGTDLYQWFSQVGGSAFSDPFGEPFTIRASSVSTAQGDGEGDAIWRHEKSGKRYRIVGHFTLEADATTEMVGYVDVNDSRLSWVRPVDDFYDGRFIPEPQTIAAAPASPGVEVDREAEREAIARIIHPRAFELRDQGSDYWANETSIAKAVAKADAILERLPVLGGGIRRFRAEDQPCTPGIEPEHASQTGDA